MQNCDMMLTTAAKLEMGIQKTKQNLFNPSCQAHGLQQEQTKYETSELLMSHMISQLAQA